MAKQDGLTLKQFHQKFPDDDACLQHLRTIRWPNGFICPECGGKEYSYIGTRKVFQCSSCRHQASATSGTIMHRTRTPLLTWFWAVFLISHDKRGVSATFLAKELEVSYPTAWLMLQKIRKAMRDRDAGYKLAGIVELDEAYFGAPTEGGKRGRGTDKTLVLVGVSLTPTGYPKYVKMQIIPDLKGPTFVTFAEEKIKEGSRINSDALGSYQALAEAGYTHHPKKYEPKEDPDHLHWMHTMISNAKAFIAGTFHGLDKKHLQRYLDEFCYRTNRRKMKGEWFDRLLNACCYAKTITYTELVS